MHRQDRLLFDRLEPDETHRRPDDGLADRFSVRRVILVPLDVRLHIGGGNEAHLVAHCAQLPAPIMRCRARLDADQTVRQSFEIVQNLAPSQLPPHDNRARRINSVNLENILGEIQTYRRNIAHGRLLFSRG